MIRENAASRLHRILEKASKGSPKERAWQVWVKVLDIPAGSDEDQQLEVARIIGLLRRQLVDVEHSMHQTGLPEELYQEALANVRALLVVNQLVNQWANYLPHLDKKGVLDKLAWCVHAIPSEPPPPDPTVLGELRDELRASRERILGSDLPAALKAMLLEHIDAMLRAIRDYPVTGPDAVGRAFMEIAASAAARPHVYAQATGTAEGRKTGQLLSKLRTFGVGLNVLANLLTGGIKMVEVFDETDGSSQITVLVQDQSTTIEQIVIQHGDRAALAPSDTLRQIGPSSTNSE